MHSIEELAQPTGNANRGEPLVLLTQEIAKESRLRKGQTDFRSDRDVKMVGGSLAGRVSTRRYKILGTLGAGSLRAHDLVWGHAAANLAAVKRRFEQERFKGLDSRYRGSQRRVRTAQLEAKILEATRKGPSDGTTHWSSYRLAKHLGVSHTTVYRVWRQFGIQPHRLRRYMASDDPQFEEKAADVIALYLNPPEHAAVFAVDEKSAIQALDRLDPVLPLSPGRAERHGFEYYRHGTLSLYAALNTRSGQVLGKTTPRHTSTQFVEFLGQIVASQPKEKEIHIIADNLSAHKTKEVSAFVQANPHVRIHYTPTYSS